LTSQATDCQNFEAKLAFGRNAPRHTPVVGQHRLNPGGSRWIFLRVNSMKRAPVLISAIIAICWIAAHAAPAMAQDLRVIRYQNTVEGLVSRWAAAEITLEGKLVPVLQELEQKRAISSPSDADKARIAELTRQRDDLTRQMESESNNLRVEMIVVEVEPGAPETDMIQIPGWLTRIIKSKGIPVGHGITLVPDASFDVKARKLKSLSLGLRFSWG
jgi:hypothetical protein